MTSREIGELTGKQHKHVIRVIRIAEPSYLKVYGTQTKFGLSEYTDPTGRKLPEYQLNKSQTLFLVSGYDAILRAKIQFRWEELESKAIYLPSKKELAQMVIEQENKIEALEEDSQLKEAQITNQHLQLRQAAPKVEYHDEVLGSKGAIHITVIAKTFGMSAMALNKILNEEKVQFRTEHTKHFNKKTQKWSESFTWVPYRKYQAEGYCTIQAKNIKLQDGSVYVNRQLLWFEKGQKFIYNLLKKRGMISPEQQELIFQ